MYFIVLCKTVTTGDFKQAGNKEDVKALLIFSPIKLANIYTLSLITLTRVFEVRRALFSVSLSISFLISSALTLVKSKRFYLTGDMTNLYPFIQGSLE